MFIEHPEVSLAENINDREFYFGNDMLVAPKVFEIMDPYTAMLPGSGWYDYWTGQKVNGKEAPAWAPDRFEENLKAPQVETVKLNPKLDELPVYVRPGAIIPHQPLVQTTSETPQGPLELRVYPGPNCSGSVYTDDGHTLDYKKGHYFRQSFTCEATPQSVTVTLAAPQGDYTPWWTQVRVTVYGGAQPVSRDLPFSREPQTVIVTY
jgi:alpha-glucosidase